MSRKAADAIGGVTAVALLTALYGVLCWPALRQEGLGAPMLAPSLGLGAALVWLSVIDIRSYRLPDAITLPLAAAGPVLAWAFGWGDPVWRCVAAAGGYLFLFAVAWAYRAARGRDGLGLGDAKLFAAAGAWLGWEGLAGVLLWATGTALAWAGISALRGVEIGAASRIAFGPFLALGFWLVWLYGAP